MSSRRIASTAISLSLFFPNLDWANTKFHIAQRTTTGVQPIDVFSRDYDEWRDTWTGGYHSRKVWNKQFVFNLIEMPSRKDRWLFGGVVRVIDVEESKRLRDGNPGWWYTVEDIAYGKELIGRLVIDWNKDSRSKHRVPLNSGLLDSMSVAELTPEPYQGEDFPGHGAIDHSYATLESLWRDEKDDWRAALSNCRGVYLITDSATERRYVGSACSDTGIWRRWQQYFSTGGHAGNKRLKRYLIEVDADLAYEREHFRFCLLERASSRESDDQVIAREAYWKRVLLSRGQYGLNDN